VDALNTSIVTASGTSTDDLRDDLRMGRSVAPIRDASLDTAVATRLVRDVDALATALVARGRLETRRAIWWQRWTWLVDAISGSDEPGEPRPATDAWEPLLMSVLRNVGSLRNGTPASGGTGVGRAVRVVDESDATTVEPGDVLVASRPIPALAPLLWEGAAIVTEAGGPGAHLFEVARALHRPAVAGVGPTPPGATMVSVDGDTGETRWWAR
jgi:hypothetical protein